jgi:protein-S-isoprenylcysteine O-methyltransferase Ste14
MDLQGLYQTGSAIMLGLAVLSFPALLFVNAPYGRFAARAWGPRLDTRLGWVLMESPAVVFFGFVFLTGEHAFEAIPLFFLILWQLHYLQRAFLYPLLMRTGGKGQTVVAVALGAVFQLANAPLNALAVSEVGQYDVGWIASPQFWVGIVLFLSGYAINLHSDGILRRLRRPGETGYRIPHGGLFRWITSPNYFGEIVEWCGWALATGSLAGLAFAAFTGANLVPRALANHRWYRKRFPDYPPSRKAVIPGIL